MPAKPEHMIACTDFFLWYKVALTTRLEFVTLVIRFWIHRIPSTCYIAICIWRAGVRRVHGRWLHLRAIGLRRSELKRGLFSSLFKCVVRWLRLHVAVAAVTECCIVDAICGDRVFQGLWYRKNTNINENSYKMTESRLHQRRVRVGLVV